MGGPEREGKKENGKNEMRRKGDVTRTPLSFMTDYRHCSQSLSFFECHVSNILTMCSQRMYLLKCLKSQGLPAKQLSVLDTLLKSNNWVSY